MSKVIMMEFKTLKGFQIFINLICRYRKFPCGIRGARDMFYIEFITKNDLEGANKEDIAEAKVEFPFESES